MKNALTIDVEDWYHAKLFNFDENALKSCERRIDYGLNTILDLLDKYNVKGTFFILGSIAEERPDIVRDIRSKGHQIGYHGDCHELVFTQTKEAFYKEITYSKSLLEDISGDAVTYFRASSWSIDKRSLWALEMLEEAGYELDSSIQPFKTFLSGMSRAPLEPFHPIIGGKQLNLLEFPVTVLPLGALRIPFAGGLYLRALPQFFIENSLSAVGKSRDTLIYTHPWEYDEGLPKVSLSPIKTFSIYYNIKNTRKKFESLLENFEFAPLCEVIYGKKYKALEL